MTTSNGCEVYEELDDNEEVDELSFGEEDNDDEHISSDVDGEFEDDKESDDEVDNGDVHETDDNTFMDEDELIKNMQEESLVKTHEGKTSWRGFKLVGDNIDKNVRRSFQRSDRTTKSLHYFHTYALLDRIDLTRFSDQPSKKAITFGSLLPSTPDIVNLKGIFSILVSR